MTNDAPRANDAIEIATAGDSATTKLTVASGKLQSLGGDVAIGSFVPRQALGAGAVGALKMRLVQGDTLGEWQPLVRVVRLPALSRVACPDTDCTIEGEGLFLIASVAGSADGAGAVAVPAGYVGTTFTVPRPAGDRLYLKLLDAPEDVVTVAVGKPLSYRPYRRGSLRRARTSGVARCDKRRARPAQGRSIA